MITVQIKYSEQGKPMLDYFDTITQKFKNYNFPNYAYDFYFRNDEKCLLNNLYLTEYNNDYFYCYQKHFLKVGQSTNVDSRIKRTNLEVISNEILKTDLWYKIHFLEQSLHERFKSERLDYTEIPSEQWEKKGVPFDGATECYPKKLHFDLAYYVHNAELVNISSDRVTQLILEVVELRERYNKNLKLKDHAKELINNPLMGSMNRVKEEKAENKRIEQILQEMNKSNPMFFSDDIPIGQTDDKHEIATENALKEATLE